MNPFLPLASLSSDIVHFEGELVNFEVGLNDAGGGYTRSQNVLLRRFVFRGEDASDIKWVQKI